MIKLIDGEIIWTIIYFFIVGTVFVSSLTYQIYVSSILIENKYLQMYYIRRLNFILYCEKVNF